MQKKQVAVIDIGSSKITAVIGERGINKTFVIKGRYSFEYDGFENGVFFELSRLQSALYVAGLCLKKRAVIVWVLFTLAYRGIITKCL